MFRNGPARTDGSVLTVTVIAPDHYISFAMPFEGQSVATTRSVQLATLVCRTGTDAAGLAQAVITAGAGVLVGVKHAIESKGFAVANGNRAARGAILQLIVDANAALRNRATGACGGGGGGQAGKPAITASVRIPSAGTIGISAVLSKETATRTELEGVSLTSAICGHRTTLVRLSAHTQAVFADVSLVTNATQITAAVIATLFGCGGIWISTVHQAIWSAV